jgi:iron complex transport system substrate-binding protein
MAAYLADAGADYLWKDAPGNRALPLTLEAVFSRAGQADFWLLTEAVQNLEEISRSDSRFKLFNAYARGRVYNNNARVNARGGNDFWEDGVARPDEVLSDLVKIFHPDLVPGHEWIWYRKLE